MPAAWSPPDFAFEDFTLPERPAAHAALGAGAPAARHPGRRGRSPRVERGDRRRHREPVSQLHAVRHAQRRGVRRDHQRAGRRLLAGCAGAPAGIPRRHAARAAARCDRRLRRVARPLPADRADRVPTGGRHAARARARRRSRGRGAEAARPRPRMPWRSSASATTPARSICSTCSTRSARYGQARLGLAQAQGQHLSDTAQLFVALGGGWWGAEI